MNEDEKPKMSRRRFLALAGGTVGVTTLACCGLATLNPQQSRIDFAESNCGGENEMDEKILVAYASKCGSTGGVAEAIGQTLCTNGTAADVQLVKNVTDVSPYQAVIVGSAVRMGQWLPDAVKFVEKHREPLSRVPVAYFSVCMTLQDDTEENRREVAGYIDPVREIVQPVTVGAFAGAMDYDQLSFILRSMLKAMKVPEGDYRDWNAIRAWATNVGPMLLST